VIITGKGRAKLRKSVPSWRRAQKRLEAALGAAVARALNAVLDIVSAKLRKSAS
jgi:hypothetical protein